MTIIRTKNIIKYLILFGIGGIIYYLIECAFHLVTTGEAYSHWTMIITGGIAFLACGVINEFFTWKIPFWNQCLIGAIIITTIEFIVGCIVNLLLEWDVWDYSGVFGNVLGQICLPFSLIWVLLSGVAIIVDDYLRYFLFNEEKPKYRIK